jgi:pimeloyl-ACP methyl ester carboxylesterase
MNQDFYNIPRYKFFQVEENRRIAYLEYGENNMNTIICVHGLTRNSSDYHFLSLKLEKNGYRVIVPDIAGRGGSDNLKNSSNYNYHFYRGDLLKLADFLEIKNCFWIGTSMGGIIAFLVNEIRPNFIKKLVLNDIGPQISLKATKQIHNYFLKIPEKYSSLEEIEKRTKLTFTFFGISKKEDWKFFIDHSIKKNDDNTYSFRYDSGIFNSLSDHYEINKDLRGDGIWDIWGKLKMPILLIWGNLSTMLTSDVIKKMQKNADLCKITIHNVGHTPHFMNDDLNKEIILWLKEGFIKQNEIKNFII